MSDYTLYFNLGSVGAYLVRAPVLPGTISVNVRDELTGETIERFYLLSEFRRTFKEVEP